MFIDHIVAGRAPHSHYQQRRRCSGEIDIRLVRGGYQTVGYTLTPTIMFLSTLCIF